MKFFKLCTLDYLSLTCTSFRLQLQSTSDMVTSDGGKVTKPKELVGGGGPLAPPFPVARELLILLRCARSQVDRNVRNLGSEKIVEPGCKLPP